MSSFRQPSGLQGAGPLRIRCRLSILPLLLCLVSGGVAAAEVSDTGQPFDTVVIASSEGTWMSVDVSPSGGQVAFDLLGDLYLMPANGGEAMPLRQGPAVDRLPRFSPDGTQIAFVSDADGYDNLWIVNADGSGARQVSRESESLVTLPAWSADGRYLVARRLSVEGYSAPHPFGRHIWLYPAAGGPGRKLIEGHNALNEPGASRDGRFVYYTADSSPLSFSKKSPDDANPALKRHDLGTGQSETLVSGYGGSFASQISPNGALLAFVRRVSTRDVLFVYDTSTRRQRPVHDGLSRDIKVHPASDGYYPSFGWFPDNRHVAIWAKGKLLKIDVQTGESRQIPFHAKATHQIVRAVRTPQRLHSDSFVAKAIGRPSAAADGRRLYFGAVGHLWMKRLPDGKPVRLTDDDDHAYDPVLSPDGRELLYVEWNDLRGSALQLMNLERESVRTLLTLDGIVAHPVFSVDGSKIAFQVVRPSPFFGGYHQRPGIYWMPINGSSPIFVASDGAAPEFSLSGERLYLNLAHQGEDRVSILRSVALDGTGGRDHVRSAQGHDFRLSPDGRWVAFRQNHGVYVAPYVETGTVTDVSATSAHSPSFRLSRHRGLHQHWSADSSRLHWLSGDDYFSASAADFKGTAPLPPPGKADLNLVVERGAPDGQVAFVGARIITMKGDEILEDGVLIVDGNRIAAIGAAGSVAVPAAARIYDVEGKTIMPGLVDAHTHLLLDQPPEGVVPRQFSRYYANLAYGVTTTFDPYAPTEPVFRLAEMVKAGRMVGPRILSTGDAFMGFPSSPLTDVTVTSFESARDHVRRMHDAGAIAIKSYIQPGRIQRQQLVAASRENGLLVVPEGEGHFYHDLSMILDGFTTVEHNLPVELYEDVIQLFAHSATASTPTLMVNQAELNGMQYFYQSTPIWEMEKLRRFTALARGFDRTPKPLWAHRRTITAPDEIYEVGVGAMARSLERLNDAGVLVNMGSHGEIDGIGAIWELWLIHQGGFSNHDTLRIGTINGATTLGLNQDIGSLEPGKLADLIVLDKDPLIDIQALDTVIYTMVDGRLYESLSMNEIGNYDRPRPKFYWETGATSDIDWNESMIGGGQNAAGDSSGAN